MGIMFHDAMNLLDSRRGVSGGRAVTLGRLTAYFHPSDIRTLLNQDGLDDAARQWLNAYEWGAKADGFFLDVLKFDSVDSIDVSKYQGATLIHDLSEPLPPELERKFDLAVDGGTLEHVFNFPVAVRNLMKLVRPGGFVYSLGPCNNMAGHGFYQFSPELMYRIFSEENGYEPVFVRLVQARYRSIEFTSGHKVYEAIDPDKAGGRVGLTNARPTLIVTMAKCVRACEPFQQQVLQSDYVAKWNDDLVSRTTSLKNLARRWVPKSLWTMARGMVANRRASFRNTNHYKRLH